MNSASYSISSGNFDAPSPPDQSLEKQLWVWLIFSVLSPIGAVIPLIGAGLVIWVQKKRVSDTCFMIYGSSIALYLGFVNTTKKLAGDLVSYWDMFYSVKYLPFFQCIFSDDSSREPGYMLLNYCIFYLTGGNWKLFLLIVTFLIYCFGFAAIVRCFRNQDVSPKIVIISFGVLALNGQFLQLSSHLIRQCLAVEMMVFALAYLCDTNKIRWGIVIFSTLVQGMVIVFLPFLLFRPFREKISPKKMFYMLLACATVAFSGYYVLINYLPNYAISQKIILALDGNYSESGGITVAVISYLLLTVLSAAAVLLLLLAQRHEQSLILFSNLTLFLLIFILLNLDNITVVYRYIFILYSIAPFLLGGLLLHFKKFGIFAGSLLIPFLGGYTLWSLEFGSFTYAPWVKLCFLNPILLFFQYL